MWPINWGLQETEAAMRQGESLACSPTTMQPRPAVVLEPCIDALIPPWRHVGWLWSLNHQTT